MPKKKKLNKKELLEQLNGYDFSQKLTIDKKEQLQQLLAQCIAFALVNNDMEMLHEIEQRLPKQLQKQFEDRVANKSQKQEKLRKGSEETQRRDEDLALAAARGDKIIEISKTERARIEAFLQHWFEADNLDDTLRQEGYACLEIACKTQRDDYIARLIKVGVYPDSGVFWHNNPTDDQLNNFLGKNSANSLYKLVFTHQLSQVALSDLFEPIRVRIAADRESTGCCFFKRRVSPGGYINAPNHFALRLQDREFVEAGIKTYKPDIKPKALARWVDHYLKVGATWEISLNQGENAAFFKTLHTFI